jgi:crossover junction endodeoxyribonuclease RuvC
MPDGKKRSATVAGCLLRSATAAQPGSKVLVGLDPGFASLGLARVHLLEGGGERVARLRVLRTKASSKKHGVYACDDNVRRAVELAEGLEEWITPGVIAICAESQSWPRNSAVCAKLGHAWGIIASVAHRHGLPVLQRSPQDIKRAVTGSATASKKAVQAALVERYGPLRLPTQVTLHEHCCDALGAVVACLDAPEIQMVRRLAG